MGRRVLSRQTISAYSESDSEGEEKEEEDEEDGFIKQPRHNVKEGEEKKKRRGSLSANCYRAAACSLSE